MLEKIYSSISRSLKSNSREKGPRLYCKQLDTIIGGDANSAVNKSDFASKVVEVIHNSTPAEYYEHTLKEYNTKISSTGALVAYSGMKTGRSPNDRRIVKSFQYESDLWYPKDTTISQNVFYTNKETATCYLNNLDKNYVFDGYACLAQRFSC